MLLGSRKYYEVNIREDMKDMTDGCLTPWTDHRVHQDSTDAPRREGNNQSDILYCIPV
jgi:hypothetical protein